MDRLDEIAGKVDDLTGGPRAGGLLDGNGGLSLADIDSRLDKLEEKLGTLDKLATTIDSIDQRTGDIDSTVDSLDVSMESVESDVRELCFEHC